MWLRRRFSMIESSSIVARDDDDVALRGFRIRPERLSLECTSSSDMDRSSGSPVDSMSSQSSPGRSSHDSEATLKIGGNGLESDDDDASVSVDPFPTLYTPVMRRRRTANHQRRNYRIMDPDESLMVLQQQCEMFDTTRKGRILRRKSTKRDVELPPIPMVITPPVLLNRTQSCALCLRDTEPHEIDTLMSPTTASSTPRLSDEEAATRLSLVSSSTGYSSARSSLRSSDGTDESNPRDSAYSFAPSLSSLRQEFLTQKGAITHLDRIAIELIDTEKTYVNDLNDVIRGYMDFMVNSREHLGITLDDISSLFGCIERIYTLNNNLYQQLDQAQLDCVRMCKCFVDNSSLFEDYIAYCTNYHRMLTTLSKMQQNCTLAAVLTERQQVLAHALPLSSYLLKPVQRILKYHLFIENMMKNMPNTTSPEDMQVIKRAYEVMTAQATKINDEKKKAEHADRVLQLQAALQKWKVDKTGNLSAYGDLLLEAQFRQAGSKTLRTLFLFEEMLLIVKQRGSTYACKDYIMCSNLMLNELISNDEPLAFQVLSFDNPRIHYVFLASSSEQKRIWMTELKRMMLDHYGIEIPEKTKQLMLSMDNTQKVAFGRPEFAEVSTKNHKKVPKYLEKRRKSMDQETRRRSLSASRLLATSKNSILPDMKISSRSDSVAKCTCHLNPGTSIDRMRDSRAGPVLRTMSASTIDINNVTFQPKPQSDIQSSRSRFYQARNRRHLPPKDDSRSSSMRRLDDEDIAATFDELYRELVAVGKGNDPSFDASENRLNGLVIRPEEAVIPPAARNLRSKSLTRLNDCTLSAKPLLERRYSKLDEIMREWTRKASVDERDMSSIRELHEEHSQLPSSCGREYAPFHQHIAQFDQNSPSVGMVKSRILQLEKRGE